MWENQSLFRVSAQLFADGVFNLLDRTLKPEVFLLGLASARETDEPEAVVVEPVSHRYHPADFASVKARAGALEPDGPREVVYHLHPLDHDRFEKQRWYELLRRATEHTLNDLVATRHEDRVSFCSLPVGVYGYQVIIVLQLSAEAYQAYYSLPGQSGGNRAGCHHSVPAANNRPGRPIIRCRDRVVATGPVPCWPPRCRSFCRMPPGACANRTPTTTGPCWTVTTTKCCAPPAAALCCAPPPAPTASTTPATAWPPCATRATKAWAP